MGEPERRLLTPEEYQEAQASPEFMELKKRFRAFAFPMTVAFLAWYLLYVLLSTYESSWPWSTTLCGAMCGMVILLCRVIPTVRYEHSCRDRTGSR